MTYMSLGIWIADATGLATQSLSDELAGTEGVNYVHFTNSPKFEGQEDYEMNVHHLIAAVDYAMPLGKVQGSWTITDVCANDNTDYQYIYDFCTTKSQSNSALYLFRCRDGTGSGAPTVNQHFYNGGTQYDYLKCRITSFRAAWDEETQLYKVRVGVESCWD